MIETIELIGHIFAIIIGFTAGYNKEKSDSWLVWVLAMFTALIITKPIIMGINILI